MSPRTLRFTELQELINYQIDNFGEADPNMVDEMMSIGDSLTDDEIREVTGWNDSMVVEDDWDDSWVEEYLAV